jgi:hypothetical protein
LLEDLLKDLAQEKARNTRHDSPLRAADPPFMSWARFSAAGAIEAVP